jgi:hypothetical protein
MEQLLNNTPINWVQVTDPKTGRIYYAPAPSIYPEKGLEGNTDISDINVTNTLITASLIPGFSDTPAALEFTKGDDSTFSISLDITPASSSYALTASYVETAQTASYVLNAISSSYALTASYAVSSSHEIIKEVSSSYADTASFAQSGDGIFSGSFSGSFEGIANTSSYALTASYVETAQTASYVLQAISASYATQALSASWAPGGAGTPTFPYTGSAIISGSLEITGSLFVQDINGKTNIDSLNRQLYGTAPPFPPSAPSVLSIDWGNRYLQDTSGTPSTDWANRITYDNLGNTSFDWGIRSLLDSSNTVAANWDAFALNYKIETYTYLKKFIDTSTQDLFSDVGVVGFNYEGEVIGAAVDGTVNQFDLVYLETDGKWYPVTQGTADCSKLLGICAATGARAQIILEGSITINDGTYTDTPLVQSPSHGLPIYIRDGAGNTMSTVVPTTLGEYVRILGHAYHQQTGTPEYWIMKFRPSNDWIEI